MIPRIVALLLSLSLVLVTATASAHRCGSAANEWVQRCATASGLAMRLHDCPASVAVVEVTGDLRVEVSTSPSAFRRVGSYGLSPVGSFEDWKLEPASRRGALDAIVACVGRDPPEDLLPSDAPPPSPDGRPVPTSQHPPLLLAIALGLALIAHRPRKVSPSVVAPIAIALGAILLTVFVRRLWQPAAFFHQNGQGPDWVRFAIVGDAGAYGPGYPEVFGFLASRAKRPDYAVFLAQELLAATVPVSAYAIARAIFARRSIALGLAVALALDPILARTARSESYFATIGALVFIAAALVACSDAGSGWRSARDRYLGWIAAGFVVAQAARIHPLAWVACAMVSLPLLVAPGRRRWRRAAIATAVVGIVSLPLALSTMRAALGGWLGGSFLPGARALATATAPLVVLALAVTSVLLVRPGTRRLGTRLFVVAVTVSAALVSNVVAEDAPAVSAAYVHLFLPPLIAVLARLPARVALASAALAALHGVREHRDVALPTDARELAWCQEWREQLPRGSSVAYLARLDRRILSLPLSGVALPRAIEIDEATKPLLAGAYYYRSSICSTPEASALCTAFEAKHRLRAIESRRFPARASLPWLPLPPGELEVALFIVE